MQVLSLIIASIVGFLTAVTLLLALWRKHVALMRRIALETLIDVGLVKHRSGADDEAWPNGSDNLPDFLRTLWESLESSQAQLHQLVKTDQQGGNACGD